MKIATLLTKEKRVTITPTPTFEALIHSAI